jgi:hypothetical protein
MEVMSIGFRNQNRFVAFGAQLSPKSSKPVWRKHLNIYKWISGTRFQDTGNLISNPLPISTKSAPERFWPHRSGIQTITQLGNFQSDDCLVASPNWRLP